MFVLTNNLPFTFANFSLKREGSIIVTKVTTDVSGCTITNTSWRDNTTPPETSRDIPPEEYVEGCLIQYYYVEIIQAGVQCILTVSISRSITT